MEADKDQRAMATALIRQTEAAESDSIADLPSFYFNSAEFGISLSDVCIIASLDGVRKSRLHMSYTTAKTLMRGLQQVISDFERAAEHTIMTMDETNAALTSLQPKEAHQEEE